MMAFSGEAVRRPMTLLNPVFLITLSIFAAGIIGIREGWKNIRAEDGNGAVASGRTMAARLLQVVGAYALIRTVANAAMLSGMMQRQVISNNFGGVLWMTILSCGGWIVLGVGCFFAASWIKRSK
jgi:hypothetical protein